MASSKQWNRVNHRHYLAFILWIRERVQSQKELKLESRKSTLPAPNSSDYWINQLVSPSRTKKLVTIPSTDINHRLERALRLLVYLFRVFLSAPPRMLLLFFIPLVSSDSIILQNDCKRTSEKCFITLEVIKGTAGWLHKNFVLGEPKKDCSIFSTVDRICTIGKEVPTETVRVFISSLVLVSAKRRWDPGLWIGWEDCCQLDGTENQRKCEFIYRNPEVKRHSRVVTGCFQETLDKTKICVRSGIRNQHAGC